MDNCIVDLNDACLIWLRLNYYQPSTDTLAIESPVASTFFLFTRQTNIYIYELVC